VEFNIADLFEAVVDTVGPAEAIVCGGAEGIGWRQTYAELESRINRAATVLADAGIGRDDAVGLHLHNGHEFIEVMLACYKLRAVPVNVNYRYVAAELSHLFVDAELRAVVTEPGLAPAVERVRADCPELGSVIVTGAHYEDRLAAARDGRPDVGPRSADDRYLLYTGGTTGPPKGVIWRHEDIYFASLGGRGTPSRGVPALTSADQIVDRVRRGDPIMRRLPLCPLIHGGAMWVALQALLTGGTIVLDTDRGFDAATALALLAGERVELTMLIGDATARPIADALAADRAAPPGSDAPRYDLSALQVVASGGAVLSSSVKRQLRDLLPGVAVIDTFGASETGGQGRLRPSELGGSPRLLTDEHTAVFDDDLHPVGPGQIGRLARRGWIPLGYHRDPERSAATFPVVDGVRWSVPGDLARVEDDGSITLLGRGSTSINTGGEKVFPEEVENVLKGHPTIFDALVVGVPDQRFGERVVAVIALRDEPAARPADGHGPSDSELEAHTRAQLAGYKIPRAFVRVDRCHRLPTGKPDYTWARSVAVAAASTDPAPTIRPGQ
jgi:3-oxocholest-4-en-26-oate---CoA ligase